VLQYIFSVRSIDRKCHDSVPKEAFGPCQGANRFVIRSKALRPTVGFEMTLRDESKSLSNVMNFKRRATVLCIRIFNIDYFIM
jgi:hypothetical protein